MIILFQPFHLFRYNYLITEYHLLSMNITQNKINKNSQKNILVRRSFRLKKHITLNKNFDLKEGKIPGKIQQCLYFKSIPIMQKNKELEKQKNGQSLDQYKKSAYHYFSKRNSNQLQKLNFGVRNLKVGESSLQYLRNKQNIMPFKLKSVRKSYEKEENQRNLVAQKQLNILENDSLNNESQEIHNLNMSSKYYQHSSNNQSKPLYYQHSSTNQSKPLFLQDQSLNFSQKSRTIDIQASVLENQEILQNNFFIHQKQKKINIKLKSIITAKQSINQESLKQIVQSHSNNNSNSCKINLDFNQNNSFNNYQDLTKAQFFKQKRHYIQKGLQFSHEYRLLVQKFINKILVRFNLQKFYIKPNQLRRLKQIKLHHLRQHLYLNPIKNNKNIFVLIQQLQKILFHYKQNYIQSFSMVPKNSRLEELQNIRNNIEQIKKFTINQNLFSNQFQYQN